MIRPSSLSRTGIFAVLLLFVGAPALAPSRARAQAKPAGAADGAFTHSLAIEVPPYHGLEPKLALSYHSHGGNGFVGVGWSLSGFSVIERASPGRGAPKYDASDIYLLDGTELVPSTGLGGTHATKVQSYQRITRDGANNRWYVWHKDGTKATFTRVFDVGPGPDGTWGTVDDATWKWGLTSVADPRGNTVTYNWAANQFGCCWAYPDSVTYNGTTVKLHWETRPDVETHAYGGGLESLWGRIKTIDVTVGGAAARAYKLTYATSSHTSRSLLQGVQQFGTDRTLDGSGTVTGGTALPPVSFTPYLGVAAFEGLTTGISSYGYNTGWYQDLTTPRFMADVNGDGKADIVGFASSGVYVSLATGTGFTSPALWVASYGTSAGGWTDMNTFPRTMADVNGDGKADIVGFASTGVVVSLSTGTGFTSPALWVASYGTNASAGGWSNNTTYPRILADVNGDGKADIVGFASTGVVVSLSTGAGFTSPALWVGDFGTAQGFIDNDTSPRTMADVNGDGKADIVGFGYNGVYVSLSTGTGFTNPGLWMLYYGTGAAAGGWSNMNTYPRIMADVNGDGKADIVGFACDGVYVSLSTGAGVTAPALWVASYGTLHGYADNYRYPRTLVDVNGDGKADIVGFGPSGVNVSLSNGAGFGLPAVWVGGFNTTSGYPNNDACPRHVVDVNGDGLPDVVGFSYANGVYVAKAYDYPADRLKYLYNGLGGSTQVTYTPSSAWANTNNPPVARTVSAVTVADGRGVSQTTTYSYAGGLWDHAERQFMGFRYVKSWTPGGAVNETYYHQTYGARGKPRSVYVKNATGGGFPYTYTYTSAQATPPGAGACPCDTRTLYADCGTSFDSAADLGATCIDRAQFYTNEYHVYTRTINPQSETFAYSCFMTSDAMVACDASADDTSTSASSPPYVSTLLQQTDYECDGAGTCKRTHQVRAYDAYGNVTRQENHGDYDAAGDETTIVTTFRPNAGLYIVDKPAAVQVFQGLATTTLLADALHVYDANTTWDAAPTMGSLTEQQRWVDTTNSYVVKKFAYDSYGNVTKRTNELGAADTVVYDPTYHVYPTAVTNALAQTGTSTIDYRCGAELSATNANGQTITRSYDQWCRLTRTDGPLGGYEVKDYLNFGNPTTQYVETRRPGADGVEHWERKYFDGLGRTYKTAARGVTDITTQTEYNARGQVDRRSAAYYPGETVKWTTFAYDLQDRVTRVTAPDGKFRTTSYAFAYNAADPDFSVARSCRTDTDELGHAVRTCTDIFGRTLTTTEFVPGGEVRLRFAYDARGELAQVTDGGGSVRSYTYDSLGRKLAMTDPNAGTWSYLYDAAGRMTRQTDAKAQVTTYGYDALGRRTQKVVKAADGTTERTVTWGYDAVRSGYYNKGGQTSMTDPSGTATYDYDAAGRLVKASRTVSGTAYTLARDYDAAGRLLSMTFPDGDQVAGILYDAAGRVTAVPGIVTGATYNAAGALLTQTNANGTVTTHTYDANRAWLTAISTLKGTTTIQNLAYTHDDEGKVTAVQSPFAGEGWTYGYDELHRLTAATNTSNGADSQTFAYGANNNLTTNSRLGTYSYPAASAARPHAVTAAGANAYSYDANGNMVAGAGRTLTWTPENLPATIGNATLTYDGNGTRLTKGVAGETCTETCDKKGCTTTCQATTTTTIYLGDDYEVTGTTATKYVAFAGRPVAKIVGTAKYWLHTDDKGSVQAVTDASGLEVQRLKYRPYGERLATGTSHVEARSYLGQRQDESGLIYLHARYYDPALGRFISPDPLLDTRTVGGPNGYAYSGNDPVNGLDLDGQSMFSKAFRKAGKSLGRLAKRAARVGLKAMKGLHKGMYELGVHSVKAVLKGGVFTAAGRDEMTEGFYEMARGLNETPWIGGIAALPCIAAGAALQGDALTAVRAVGTFVLAVVAIAAAVVLAWTGYGGYVGGMLLSFTIGFVSGFLIGVINGVNSGRSFYSGMAFGAFCAFTVYTGARGINGWGQGYQGFSSYGAALRTGGAFVGDVLTVAQGMAFAGQTVRGYSGPKQQRFDHRFDYVGHGGFGGNTMGGPLAGATPWNYNSYLHDMAGAKEGYSEYYGHSLMPRPMSYDLGVYYRTATGDSYL